MSLYRLDDKTLGRLLSKSPEDILRASSYEVDDALLRLSSEHFDAFVKGASREVFQYLAMSVSSEGALVLFFRLPDDEVGRFITSLRPKALSRFVSLLIDSVSPDIVIRRLDENTLQIVLDSLEEGVLSAFILGLSMHSLRRVLPHGGVLLQVSPEARRHILSAYRMGDMQRWGVYLTQSILSDIDKDSWAILAPRLSGKDWNMVFTALDEDTILKLLRDIDRRTMRRLIRRIDKDIFMAFLMSVSDRLGDILDITMIDEVISGSALDISMTLHLYSTDKKKAVDILRRIPPSLISSFVLSAPEYQVSQLANVLASENMLEDMLFALPGEASLRLYSLSEEKEVYPELLLLWLSHGLDIRGVPMPFICALVSSLDGEHLAMIRPSEDISRCILQSGVYSLLDEDTLWKHIMALPPSDNVLATIRVPWESAPPQVFRKHREILSRILVGIPDGMLEVMYEDGVPENAPSHMVKRWAFLDGVDVNSGVDELLKRGMYEDVYALMKAKGIVAHALVPEVLQYADEQFISDIIMRGYGYAIVDTPIWNRLGGQQKALVLLSLDAERRKALLASMKEDIWDILAQIDDVDVMRVLAEDITLSAEDFLAHKEKFPLSALGVLADRVDDIEPLFQHWPEGVYHSRRMQQEAQKFTQYLDEKALIFLICSGDIPFTGDMAYLVDKIPDTCIREIKEAWQYLQPQRLKSVLVSTGESDVDLWKIVYNSGLDVKEASPSVRYKLWKETGDCSLLSENDVLILLEKDPSVARCMPFHLWKQFIEERNNTYLTYMPEEVFKELDEDDVAWVLSHVPHKVDGLMKMWGRQKVMTFLAQYLPALAIEHMTEDDIPYVKDVLKGDFLKQAIEKYSHLLWREICRLEDTVNVSVSAEDIDSEEMLLCLKDHGVSFSGSVQIPVKPSTMRWLYKEGLVPEKTICRSLEVYGDEYVNEGYVPDRGFLGCLRTVPKPQNIYKLVSLGWWEDLPEEKQIALLENTGGLRWHEIPISENVAKVLLEKDTLSPYDVAYIGYSHLLKDGILPPSEAISLYKEKKLSLHELYRLSPDSSSYLDAEDIDTLLREGKYVDAPDSVIPQLSPKSVYTLLIHGRDISYDMFPPTFAPWIAVRDNELSQVMDTLPERLVRDIINYMVSNGIYHDTLWYLMSHVDIDFVKDIIHTADRGMWEHVPIQVLAMWLEAFMYRKTFSTILDKTPASVLKDALKQLSEDKLLSMMYNLKGYAPQILMECSPAEVVSSSLKVFLPLITDTVFHEWIKAYPEETYEHIRMGALLYTVKNPCILKDISESGIRRLVEVAPDDIIFEIIRRAYKGCRDVAGCVINIYADIHSLRPSEVMLRAGLVSGS